MNTLHYKVDDKVDKFRFEKGDLDLLTLPRDSPVAQIYLKYLNHSYGDSNTLRLKMKWRIIRVYITN